MECWLLQSAFWFMAKFLILSSLCPVFWMWRHVDLSVARLVKLVLFIGNLEVWLARRGGPMYIHRDECPSKVFEILVIIYIFYIFISKFLNLSLKI
jgi:hypothetical protein